MQRLKINGNRLQLLFSIFIGLACGINSYEIYLNYPHRWDYLIWDPAAHAFNGIRIAVDIQQLRIIDLIRDTNGQVLWPPMHSYLQAPFHFLFGLDFRAASLCSLAFYALFFPALTFLYQQIHGGWSGWLILTALAVTSPFYAGFGIVPMLEIFGAVLTAFSAALSLRNSRWFPLSLSLLFFLKYNYFVYASLPLFCFYMIRLFQEKDQWVIHLKSLLTPFRIFVILYVLLLALIAITGGFTIGSLSMRGVGNPLYALFLILVARTIWTGKIVDLLKRIRGTGWEYFAIPVGIWLLIPYPNRIRSILSFTINQPMGPSPDQLGFYTFYFTNLAKYFSNHFMAIGCSFAAAFAALLFRKDRKIFFITLLFLLPFGLMTMNQNKQDRYLFTFVFTLWLLASFLIERISVRALRYIVAVLLTISILLSYNQAAVIHFVMWPMASKETKAPLNFMVRHVRDAAEVRLLGTNNQLNPSLIEYHVNKASSFHIRPHIKREVEKTDPAGTHVICINTSIEGNPLHERYFPDGTRISHYVLPLNE